MRTREERRSFIRNGYETWRKKRINNGYTSHQASEAEFARRLDIPYSTWSRITGGEMVSSINVHKLASYYGQAAFDYYDYPRALPNDRRLLFIVDNYHEVDDQDREKLLNFFQDEIMGELPAVAAA